MKSRESHWLDREDESQRKERLKRLRWLIKRYPPAKGFMISGGQLSMQLFEEARYCFVYAQFAAVVTLGVAFIERVLAARFYGSGRNDLQRAGGSELLDEALAGGIITRSEFRRLSSVRRLRHSLVHFRRPLAKGTLEARAISRNAHFSKIIEKDAMRTLESMFLILGKCAV